MNCKNCGHLVSATDVPYPKPVVFCDESCLDIYVSTQVLLQGYNYSTSTVTKEDCTCKCHTQS